MKNWDIKPENNSRTAKFHMATYHMSQPTQFERNKEKILEKNKLSLVPNKNCTISMGIKILQKTIVFLFNVFICISLLFSLYFILLFIL